MNSLCTRLRMKASSRNVPARARPLGDILVLMRLLEGGMMTTCKCCGVRFKPDEGNDLDFTTDALPDEIESILRKGPYKDVSTIGKKFGTLQCVAIVPPSFEDSDASPEEQAAILANDLEKSLELGLIRIRAGTHAVFKTEAELYAAYERMKTGTKEEPTMCSMCEVRGGLCLHNLWERDEKVFHSSRPHPNPNPHADDPENCPPCIDARVNAIWGRRVMKLNPVGTWPVGKANSRFPERDV